MNRPTIRALIFTIGDTIGFIALCILIFGGFDFVEFMGWQ